MSVAANTNNLIDHLFSSFACICVNTFVLDEIGVGDTGQHFSEEGDGFLFELLRIADIAEGDLFEGVALITTADFILDGGGESGNDSSDCVLCFNKRGIDVLPEEVLLLGGKPNGHLTDSLHPQLKI